MRLSRLGEFALIEKIRRLSRPGPGVKLGIGDDAAWVANRFGSSLVTADLLVEGVHFSLEWTSLFDLGYKSLAVNLSDIAAMGGKPAYLILCLAVPVDFTTQNIAEFYGGIRSLASQSGVSIIGGDTNAAASMIISPCVIGHAPYRPVRRRGAKPGHDIYVTGTIGDSALALRFLTGERASPHRSHLSYLLSRHHRPCARVTAGSLLARESLATAMIDVSDGLVQDLGHICSASGIGAEIWEDKLPLSAAYRALTVHGTVDALTGGEDYELLFCARRRDRARIESLQKRVNLMITRIGRCVSDHQGVTVLDASGASRRIQRAGHDHFQRGFVNRTGQRTAIHWPSERETMRKKRVRAGAGSKPRREC